MSHDHNYANGDTCAYKSQPQIVWFRFQSIVYAPLFVKSFRVRDQAILPNTAVIMSLEQHEQFPATPIALNAAADL